MRRRSSLPLLTPSLSPRLQGWPSSLAAASFPPAPPRRGCPLPPSVVDAPRAKVPAERRQLLSASFLARLRELLAAESVPLQAWQHCELLAPPSP